jgi:hypothetical protein
MYVNAVDELLVTALTVTRAFVPVFTVTAGPVVARFVNPVDVVVCDVATTADTGVTHTQSVPL